MLLPLTLGIMTGSIFSGQMISRTGRYRQYPIIGTGLLVASMLVFVFVRLTTDPLAKFAQSRDPAAKTHEAVRIGLPEGPCTDRQIEMSDGPTGVPS